MPPTPRARRRAWSRSLILLLACSGCLGTGAPPADVPAPGSGRFNLVQADFRETAAGWRHETRSDWVWTTVSQEGRLYGFLPADADDDRPGLPPVVADLHLDPAVGRIWLAQCEPLALRHGPGSSPAALLLDPGPQASGEGAPWLQSPLLPLLPAAQVIEGGRRARLTLFDDQRQPVLRLLLPPTAFADFERGLASALAARDAAVAEQAAAAQAAAAVGSGSDPSAPDQAAPDPSAPDRSAPDPSAPDPSDQGDAPDGEG